MPREIDDEEAIHQNDNPINVHDCAMILLEYIELNCDGKIKEAKKP